MKDSTKLSLKCLCMVDLDICITYLKNIKFNLVNYLTTSQNMLVYSVKCCTNYTNIVTQYTLVFLVYFGSSTISDKNFFTKCCMISCCIQNICAIITQIESSICKLVEQIMIYVT